MYVGLKDNCFCPPLMFNIKHLVGMLLFIYLFIFKKKKKSIWYGKANLKKNEAKYYWL